MTSSTGHRTARHRSSTDQRDPSPRSTRGAVALSGAVVLTLLATISAPWSAAAADPLFLGTAGEYSVLGGQTVTNTGTTTYNGALGVSPGSAVTGFTPDQTGAARVAAAAAQAQSDLGIAYDEAAGRAPDDDIDAADLVGLTFTEGVYRAPGPLGLTGTVTLDAQGDPNAVFIFQVASTLITGSGSQVLLTNGARACNVYWQVAESATLGTNSSFKGSILALTSITVTTSTAVEGRALARNAAVTLDSNSFVTETCGVAPSASPSATTPVPSPSATTPVPGPSATTSAPIPSATTPVPGPSATTSAPIPSATTPVPGPSATTPAPGPATTSSAPGGSGGGSGDGSGNSGGGSGGSGGVDTGLGGSGSGGTAVGTNRGTNVQTSAVESPATSYLMTIVLLGGALACGVLATTAWRQDRAMRPVRSTRRH